MQSNAGRGAGGQHNTIRDALAVCNMQLTNAAKRLNSDHFSQFPRALIDKWSEKMIDMAKESDSLTNEISFVESVVQTLTASKVDDSKQIANEIRQLTKKRLAEVDLEKAPLVKKLKGILLKAKDQEDIDFELVDEGDQETDFLDPVNMKKIVDPVKHAGCSHVLSRASIEFLLKTKASDKCPKPGCNAIWHRNAIQADKEFEYRMQRFYRIQSASERPQVDTTQILEDV